MQQQVLWGERVMSAPFPFPAAHLASVPDDGYTYEIVEGVLIKMPGSGIDASRVAARLLSALLVFAEAHGLGDVLGADATYDLTHPGDPTATVLVPDVSFVASGRLPTRNPGYGMLAPDIAVEVVSPSQYRPEMTEKAKLYIECSVRLVWIVWSNRQEVDVWRPVSPAAPVATLNVSDALDGFDALPGFTLPVSKLF